jgi:hypothetical protein
LATWQLTLSSDGRGALFPTEASRNTAVRALARAAAPHLALFSITAQDIHLVIHGDTVRPGRVARAVLLGLRPLADRPLEPARRRPIPDVDHLGWLAEHLLTLPLRHGLPGHPALWPGSSLLDLAGARSLDAPLLLPSLLRGFEPGAALAYAGLTPQPLEALGPREILLLGPGRLLHAAAMALAADPELTGRAAPVVAARQAVAQLGEQAGIPTRTLADTLQLTTHGVRRLQRHPTHQPRLTAVQRYLALEERVVRAALAAS